MTHLAYAVSIVTGVPDLIFTALRNLGLALALVMCFGLLGCNAAKTPAIPVGIVQDETHVVLAWDEDGKSQIDAVGEIEMVFHADLTFSVTHWDKAAGTVMLVGAYSKSGNEIDMTSPGGRCRKGLIGASSDGSLKIVLGPEDGKRPPSFESGQENTAYFSTKRIIRRGTPDR